MTDYTPRTGSVASRALEQIEACGPCEENVLAATLDPDVHPLKSSCTLAIANKAMRRYVGADGQWLYEPLPFARQPAAASGLPSAAIGMDPAVVLAAEAGADLAAAAAEVDGANTTHRVTAQIHTLTIPEVTDLMIERTLKVDGEPLGKSEVAPAIERPFAFALWSDGRLWLEIDSVEHKLSPDETKRLFDYLDRLLGVERPAAS